MWLVQTSGTLSPAASNHRIDFKGESLMHKFLIISAGLLFTLLAAAESEKVTQQRIVIAGDG